MATPPIGNIDLSRGQPPYNPNMGEYLIPANRSFTWETSPQEQGLLASAMGRPDLSALMATGQWGPLAGQPYQYQGGRTTIGYGGGGGMGGYPGGYPGGGLPPWQTGGYPPWQGGGVIDGPGTGGTVIIDGPGVTNGGKTYGPGGKHDNYHDWYMDPDNPFGHYWALENAARGKNRAIGEQEVASQVDQFAVNPFQGAGRNWTAPVNPYGTTAQGFRTAEQQANIDSLRMAIADPRSRGTADTLLTGPEQFAGGFPSVTTPLQDKSAFMAQREAAIQAQNRQRAAAIQAEQMRQRLGFGGGAGPILGLEEERTRAIQERRTAEELQQRESQRQRQVEMQRRVNQQQVQQQRESQAQAERQQVAANQRRVQQASQQQRQAEQQRRSNQAKAQKQRESKAAQQREQAARNREATQRRQQQSRAQAAQKAASDRAAKAAQASRNRAKSSAAAAAAKRASQAAARARNIAQEKKDKKRGRRGPGMGDR